MPLKVKLEAFALNTNIVVKHLCSAIMPSKKRDATGDSSREWFRTGRPSGITLAACTTGRLIALIVIVLS